jgi:NAD(P)-dependent dehydrogenase (short-subunit alcohol dehydrogenase family)
MNPTLLITGGSRGIGAATALLAARKGYAVAINYHSNSLAADEVVRQIRASGGQAMTVQADVADEAQVLAMFQKVDVRLGPLQALVNNAGIVDMPVRVDEMSVQRLRRMFDTNVLGSFLCAREAVRRMSTRHGGPGGAIVNVSSAAARLGSPGQYVDYAASKGAIDTFTVGWRGKLRQKESASMRCARASSRPRFMPRVDCPTVHATWHRKYPCSALASLRKWRKPLCGCCLRRPVTPPVRWWT